MYSTRPFSSNFIPRFLLIISTMSAYFTILPSAQELGRFSLSLLNSTIFAPHRRTVFNHPSLAEFDVDGESGFFPRDPLPPLPRPFDIWEAALNETTERVSLGEDESDAATEKRASSEAWRRTIKSVCRHFVASEETRLTGDPSCSGRSSRRRFYTPILASCRRRIRFWHG